MDISFLPTLVAWGAFVVGVLWGAFHLWNWYVKVGRPKVRENLAAMKEKQVKENITEEHKEVLNENSEMRDLPKEDSKEN